jgi:hypothetical protein
MILETENAGSLSGLRDVQQVTRAGNAGCRPTFLSVTGEKELSKDRGATLSKILVYNLINRETLGVCGGSALWLLLRKARHPRVG